MNNGNFPRRKLAKRKSALERRLKDVDTHSKLLGVEGTDKELTKLKIERAKSDVAGLKAKLGIE
jgi:hypothetical protein